MAELVHLTKVKVHKEPGKGKVKKAFIEGFPQPIRMGLHGGVKKFYKVESEEDLPTTLDYVVAALGSCLTGTLGSALEARSIPVGPDDLSADVEGHIENVESKPLITHVRVKYHLRVPKGKEDEARRVVDNHEKFCAVSQSLRRGIAVDWEADITESETSTSSLVSAHGKTP
jgi:uncharacterized OsmC-like protein